MIIIGLCLLTLTAWLLLLASDAPADPQQWSDDEALPTGHGREVLK
jgi:hypothetical protein